MRRREVGRRAPQVPGRHSKEVHRDQPDHPPCGRSLRGSASPSQSVSSGGWIRTSDLVVMSHARCLASLPRQQLRDFRPERMRRLSGGRGLPATRSPVRCVRAWLDPPVSGTVEQCPKIWRQPFGEESARLMDQVPASPRQPLAGGREKLSGSWGYLYGGRLIDSHYTQSIPTLHRRARGNSSFSIRSRRWRYTRGTPTGDECTKSNIRAEP